MKGEPTGKNCVKCDEPTVWKTRSAVKAGFSPVCPVCRRRSEKNYRRTEAGVCAHRNSESRRRARVYLAECLTCHGDRYYDIQRDAVCYVCGSAAEATDHIYPLAKDGLHCNDNFAPICTNCNTAKLDRLWPGHPEWEQFVLTQRAKLTTEK